MKPAAGRAKPFRLPHHPRSRRLRNLMKSGSIFSSWIISKRTFGTAELYKQYKDKISRREFLKMVKEERTLKNKQDYEKMTRIKWRIPCSCWAFDDTFYTTDSAGKKVWIHNIKDLASQYLLPPLAGAFTKGEEVAGNLQNLFITHGAPMFLKADNGPNLNSKEVREAIFSELQVVCPAL